MNSQQIVELIKRQAGAITGGIIKDLIAEHKQLRDKVLKQYSAYTGTVPILERTFTDTSKLNNKLNNDFRGDIIDLVTGYVFGHPVKYSLDKEKYGNNYEKVNGELESFLKRNHIDDLDSITGQMAAICGYGARLCYIDREGQERVMSLNPWEVIFVSDATLDEIQYALIYYEMQVIDEKGESVSRTRVEWYDDKTVTFFISNKDGDFELDGLVPRNPLPHLFDYIPVIRYVNDDTMQGDFEKVEALIDAYDRMMSDIQNEVEEFRLAYFAFFGAEVDNETIQRARQTGAFSFPEGTNGQFLTKDLNGAVQFIENHKKTLNDNIYKFSKTVDMRDEQFSGSAMSGESRKWKLVGLENKAIKKERKFKRATREMFKVICSALKKKTTDINYEDIDMQFTRTLPVDLDYYAGVTQKLKGMVTERTRLSQLPIVSDVDREMDEYKEEQGLVLDLTGDEETNEKEE